MKTWEQAMMAWFGGSPNRVWGDLGRDQILEKVKTDPICQAILGTPKFLEYTPDRSILTAARLLGKVAISGNGNLLVPGISQGFPKEVSDRNSIALTMTKTYLPVDIAESSVTVDIHRESKMEIALPEVVGYDMRHHNRYSILNPGKTKSSRFSRRIRIGRSDTCYRFWNPAGKPGIKSIFKVTIDGRSVKLSPMEAWIARSVILSVKELRDVFLAIWSEITSSVETISDQVILHGTVKNTDPGKPGTSARLEWFPWEGAAEGGINVSIL